MAGTLLHITLAHRALEQAKIKEHVRSAISSNPDSFRLGAVLVDLPYYDKLLVSALRSLAGLDIHYNSWGTLLHMRAPAELGLALFDAASSEGGVHLGLGYLTHLAVDILFHREIQKRVHLEANGARSLDAEHKRIEDDMDLHIHYDLLQSPGIGTPYARKMLRLAPHSAWSTQASLAISRIHGNTISPSTFNHWLRALGRFGHWSSNNRVPWVKSLPEDNPELLETSLALAEHAIARSSQFLEVGLAYARNEVTPADFLARIDGQSMLDGGPASAPRIPPH